MNAGKFLAGYVLGLPVARFSTGGFSNEVEFFQIRPSSNAIEDKQMFARNKYKQIDIARSSVVCLAGSVGFFWIVFVQFISMWGYYANNTHMKLLCSFWNGTSCKLTISRTLSRWQNALNTAKRVERMRTTSTLCTSWWMQWTLPCRLRVCKITSGKPSVIILTKSHLLHDCRYVCVIWNILNDAFNSGYVLFWCWE